MTASTQTQTERPLRMVRQAQGLSLRKAAERAGIDPGHLSRVERGQGGLSVEALGRLAHVLGLRELERLLRPYGANKPVNDDGPAGDRAAKKGRNRDGNSTPAA